MWTMSIRYEKVRWSSCVREHLLTDLGVLTLHLDKESYERAGIVGKPEGVKGKRGTKPRWSMPPTSFHETKAKTKQSLRSI